MKYVEAVEASSDLFFLQKAPQDEQNKENCLRLVTYVTSFSSIINTVNRP